MRAQQSSNQFEVSGTLCDHSIAQGFTYLQEYQGRSAYVSTTDDKFAYFFDWAWFMGPTLGSTSVNAYAVSTVQDISSVEGWKEYCNGGWTISGLTLQIVDSRPSGECVECPAGTYADTPGSSACTNCPTDTYQNVVSSSVCTMCAANASSPAGSVEASACACNLGYVGDGSAGCIACAPGKSRSMTRFDECANCPTGTYAETSGSSACANCLMKTYQNATSSSACTMCTAHASSPAGSTEVSACVCNLGFGPCSLCAAGDGSAGCTACEPGKSSSMIGSNNAPVHEGCAICEAGTFSNSSGATGCYFCPMGTYQNETSATVCKMCVHIRANASSPTGSVEASACACKLGFVGDGISSCAPCAVGTYNNIKFCQAA